MEKHFELLTGTRTYEKRSVTWEPHPVESGNPAAGTATITRGKRVIAYEVEEFLADPKFGAGRAFQVVKDDGVVYHLFLNDERPMSFCDCPGHTYGATEKANKVHCDKYDTLGCVHLDAVNALVRRGWLPESRVNAEADVANTES